jgi:hypothetical protein
MRILEKLADTVGEAGDPQLRLGEVVGEQAEAGDARRPAPVARLEAEQFDLERIARLGAFDADRASHLVDLGEVEVREVGGRRCRADLAVAGVERVELHHAAARDAEQRRDGRIPGKVPLVAPDVEGGLAAIG